MECSKELKASELDTTPTYKFMLGIKELKSKRPYAVTEAHLLEVKWQITDYICPSPLLLARLPIATHRLCMLSSFISWE